MGIMRGEPVAQRHCLSRAAVSRDEDETIRARKLRLILLNGDKHVVTLPKHGEPLRTARDLKDYLKNPMSGFADKIPRGCVMSLLLEDAEGAEVFDDGAALPFLAEEGAEPLTVRCTFITSCLKNLVSAFLASARVEHLRYVIWCMTDDCLPEGLGQATVASVMA